MLNFVFIYCLIVYASLNMHSITQTWADGIGNTYQSQDAFQCKNVPTNVRNGTLTSSHLGLSLLRHKNQCSKTQQLKQPARK